MKNLEYFLAGAFAALGALMVEIIVDTFSFQASLPAGEIFVLALFVLIEELSKFLVIRKKVTFTASLGSILSSCSWIGLGFGLLEFSLLFLDGKSAYSGNNLAIFSVILVHIATALLTGLALAKLKIKGFSNALAVLPALILHFLFNFWVLAC